MRISILCWCGLLTSLSAQTTLSVGPGGLPQIRTAIALAAPGDVILVAPGTYAHFDVYKPITIRALVPGTVTVAYDAAFADASCQSGGGSCSLSEGPTRFAPPSGQSVHVTDVHFAPNAHLAGSSLFFHRVEVTGGVVTFDRCTLESQVTGLSVQHAQVHLQDCVVRGLIPSGGSRGLRAVSADVTASGCTFACSAPTGVLGPGYAAELLDTVLQASHCAFVGGISAPFVPALSVDGFSSAWISDSSLTSGGTACAIVGEPLGGRIARSTVSPSGPLCGSINPGSVVGVRRQTPLRNGFVFAMDVRTEPLSLVAIRASPRLAHVEIPGLFAQPIALDLSSFFLAGLFVSDTNGDVTASWNMPAGQFVDETLWLEASAWLPGQPVLVGPVVGGVIR